MLNKEEFNPVIIRTCGEVEVAKPDLDGTKFSHIKLKVAVDGEYDITEIKHGIVMISNASNDIGNYDYNFAASVLSGCHICGDVLICKKEMV